MHSFKSRRKYIYASVALLALVGWKGYPLFRPRYYPKHTQPVLLVAGYSVKSRDLGAFVLPTGQWQKGVHHTVPSLYYANNLAPGVARGSYYIVPVQLGKHGEHWILRRYQMSEQGLWNWKESLSLNTGGANSLTCSPDGRLVAFWTSSNQNLSIYLADWQTKRIRPVIKLPLTSYDLRLACANDGTVYLWNRDPKNTAPAEYVGVNAAPVQLSHYDQIFTNQAGAFGVRHQIRYGAVELEVISIQNPQQEPRRYMADYVRGFHLNSNWPSLLNLLIGDVFSSDDGQWLGVTASEGHRSVLPVLIVWRANHEEPYDFVENNDLQHFLPVGLMAQDKPTP